MLFRSGLGVLEAKEYGRTRRTSAEILVVFQMRTTQLCRAFWLLKPCVPLSTDGEKEAKRKEKPTLNKKRTFETAEIPTENNKTGFRA